MRLQRIAAFLAAVSVMHFTLVTGELECARATHIVAEHSSDAANAGDCEHSAAHSPTAPRTPHGAPGHHTAEHGALCCAALAGCSATLASAQRAPAAVRTLFSSRIVVAASNSVPAPLFPPDTPPPKA